MKLAIIAVLVGCSSAAPAPASGKVTPMMSNTVKPADPTEDRLKITAIDPAKGDAGGGASAKITGTRLLPAAQKDMKVFFGDKPGEVVRVSSDTELVVTVPAGTAGDVVDVRITYEGGESKLVKAFTYIAK